MIVLTSLFTNTLLCLSCLFFFFFLISNENFIKKRKTTTPSTLGMYYGGINQYPRLQRSSKTGREEQENDKRPHSSQGECVKKKRLI